MTSAHIVPILTEDSMLAKVNYDGLVLTSIDVVPSPTDERPHRVTFSDNTQGMTDDDDAVFIHNIRELSRTGTGWDTAIDFEADKLTTEEAGVIIGENKGEKKALFVVHGTNTTAGFHLVDCNNAITHYPFARTHPVPVIWPSEGKMTLLNYFEDKSISKAAGESLSSIEHTIKNLETRASIVCHSMGNRVLRHFSEAEINFDNIFMVAADVDGDLFHDGYINWNNEPWRQHGLNIKDMLTNDSSKIHVIYNPDDEKMSKSKYLNFGRRLGEKGVNMKPGAWFGKSVHEKLKNSIVNINVQRSDMLYEGKSKEHNFHFFDNVCKYYDEHA